ncbi:MAG: TauD/TfdA family dioxygenase [Burkholderiales bacterium]|nr:TauD/TfdA family dioxygenase [Burkholderiales bacterium]
MTVAPQTLVCPPVSGPFAAADDRAYRQWRAAKLRDYPATTADLVVPVRDPRALAAGERRAIADRCARANMAIYASAERAADKDIPRLLAGQFGLVHLDHNWLADEDGISSVTVSESGSRRDFIPYTDRPIRWHTDGYYNPPDRRIRAMILHCVASAASGGENALLDHEIAYLQLRDADPGHVSALMQPDAMTIPARTDEHGVVRAAEAGPVFSIDAQSGALHMRYTARTRSIEWKDDPAVRAAAEWLARLLAAPSRWIHRVTLQPGMGLICNNVLHDRSGFVDAPGTPRLVYRARYHDRIDAGLR